MTENFIAPWDNVEIDETHASELSGFPRIQWLRGDPKLARVHNLLGSGGFEMPADQLSIAQTGDKHPFAPEPIMVQHGEDGAEQESYLASDLSLAVIAHRFAWFHDKDGKDVSKLNILCYVKDFDTDLPVSITFSRTMTIRVTTLLTQFRAQVIVPAGIIAKRRFPDYAFFMPVKVGQRESIGKTAKSFVTPPVAAWDVDGLKDKARRAQILASLFVDKITLAKCAAMFEAGREWREAWANIGKDCVITGDDFGHAHVFYIAKTYKISTFEARNICTKIKSILPNDGMDIFKKWAAVFFDSLHAGNDSDAAAEYANDKVRFVSVGPDVGDGENNPF